MNQSTIFSIIIAAIAFILLIIISLAYYKNTKNRYNQLVGFLGLLLIIFLLLTSLQIIFNVSNNASIVLIFRFSIYLAFPFILLQLFMFSILLKMENFPAKTKVWIEKNLISRIFSFGILLFFPLILILDYLNIPILNSTNYILSEKTNSIVQNLQKTFQTLGKGIFYDINTIFQIAIPVIIIIFSIIILLLDFKKKENINPLIHILILAISSISFSIINNNQFLFSELFLSTLDVLFLITILLYSSSFALVTWDIINQDISSNLLNSFRELSVKIKFPLLFSLLSIIFIFISSLYLYANTNIKELNSFIEIGYEKNEKIFSILENNLNNIFIDIKQLSIDFPESEGDIQDQLSILQSKHNDISLLAFIPLRGNTITATSLDETSIVLSNESWFSIVELSGNPYTGFLTDENNLLNSGIEIVFPLYLQNSRFASGYLYAKILFREMDLLNTNDIINIFSTNQIPVYSTYSYLPSDVNNFSLAKSKAANNSFIPLNTQFNNKIYYIYSSTNQLFNNTNSKLPIHFTYVENSSDVTRLSSNFILFVLIIIILIVIIQFISKLVLKNEIISPFEYIISNYKNKLKNNSFEELEIKQRDEIFSLTEILNQDYLYQNKKEDENNQKINELTFKLNRRATQLSAFTEIVSNATPSIEDINSMLTKYAQVISEQFNFYHVGIFLLDKNKEYAILQSSNSPGGKRMLARGHRLEVGRVGCVGYAASTGRPRIAQDIDSDILYYANPDMPETMSEISIPMIEENSIIGVLDIQSKQKNAFLQDDIEILTSLASQIVFSIRNYETMSNAEKNLSELSELYGEKIKDAWNKHIEKQSVQYVYKQTGVADTAELILEESTLNDPKRIQKNIKLRNQSIGKIQLKKDDSDWTEDELQLIEDIIEQSAQALETARLAEQTRARSSQIGLLQRVAAICASSLDELSILDQVSIEIMKELKLAHISFLLHDEHNNQINVIVDKSSVSDQFKYNWTIY